LFSAVIVTSAVAVVPALSSSTSFCLPLLCSLAANWRNWTKPRHIRVANDVLMEHVPLDVPNGGRWCDYNGINVHGVIMFGIPWLCTVVDGSTLPFVSLISNPAQNPFSTPKRTPHPPHKRPFETSTMVENIT
jgi:hypothetical protein